MKTGLDFSYLADVLRGGVDSGLPGGVQLLIERIEMLSSVTVDIEPPVTDEVLLVEQSSVGTEEAVLGQSSSSITNTDVEG